MNKFKLILIIFLSVLIVIFSNFLIQSNDKTVETDSKVLSNKKIGWGIKRNSSHEQPDIGETNRKILEEYNGLFLGNKDKKFLYMTFDEGYEAGYTKQILETLKKNNVKATFFITAHYVNTEPDLVKQMIDEGHIVGNHTVNHKCMPELSEEELKKEVMDLHTSIYQKFGYDMKYLRPPKGEYSEKSIAYTNSLGYKTVMWSFALFFFNVSKICLVYPAS